MIALLRTLRRLGAESRGAAAMEFGIVAPVLILFMMGIGDLLYGFYTRAIVVGAVQQAGRDGTLQMNAAPTATDALDQKVMNMVKRVAPSATFVSKRENYTNFSSVDKPEPHTDKSGGTAGKYDAGECYSDTNGNKKWDADGGRVGVGGANDVSEYTITVTYPRLFPVAGMMGWSNNATITARTVLKNQPYAAQAAAAAETICT